MKWMRLTESAIQEEPWLLRAMELFAPPGPDEAADLMSAWLEQKALGASANGIDVWLLLRHPGILAFHDMGVASVVLPAEAGSTGASQAPSRSAHVSFAARGEQHSVGDELVRHMIESASATGHKVLTLDPLDDATAAVWERHGFLPSLTPIQDDPGAPTQRQFLLLP